MIGFLLAKNWKFLIEFYIQKDSCKWNRFNTFILFIVDLNSPKAWHDKIDVLPSITVDFGEGWAVNLGACSCGDSEKKL